MSFHELEPPPKNVLSWGNHWVNWIYKLYRYVLDVASQDYWVRHAINVVAATYGDKVSVDSKNKDLLKYGRSEQVDNTASGWTVMTLPTGVQHERDLYANDIDKVTSTSTSDNGKTLVVEGHTYSGGDLTFVTQEVILSTPATTAATLSTPLARATRAYLKNSGTAGSPQSSLVGTIYFYDDNGGAVTPTAGVPSDTSYVHMMIRAGLNQTEKCSTSLSSQDYWFVTGIYADVLDKATGAKAEIDVEIRDVANGGAWRKVTDLSASTAGGSAFRTGYPYIIVPKNHDIRLVAIGDSGTGRIVSAGIFGTLAKIT